MVSENKEEWSNTMREAVKEVIPIAGEDTRDLPVMYQVWIDDPLSFLFRRWNNCRRPLNLVYFEEFGLWRLLYSGIQCLAIREMSLDDNLFWVQHTTVIQLRSLPEPYNQPKTRSESSSVLFCMILIVNNKLPVVETCGRQSGRVTMACIDIYK